MRAFPRDAGRDDGYANVNGNGYPTCYQWWNDASAGLLKLVKEQADEGMWLRARAAMKLINKDSKEFEEAIVRRLVSPANWMSPVVRYTGATGECGYDCDE